MKRFESQTRSSRLFCLAIKARQLENQRDEMAGADKDVAMVLTQYQINLSDLRSGRRTLKLVQARRSAFQLLLARGWSPAKVARYLGVPAAKAFNWRRMAKSVAERHGLNLPDILGDEKTKKVTKARQEVMSELRDRGWSYAQIGQAMARDHTTIMHGVKAHEQRLIDV